MVTRRGSNGNDRPLLGTRENDELFGLNGNDLLRGLQGDDLLDGGNGDDELNGGRGRDELRGGAGNDTYLYGRFDRIVEAARGGVDTIKTRVSLSLDSFSNVENIELIGPRAINATGNRFNNVLNGNSNNNILRGLAGSDRLSGEGGSDRLDGGVGTDFMVGGIGDDIYIVGELGDLVIEDVAQGNDTVIASVNYTLNPNLENLRLEGQAISGGGNDRANELVGNAAANVLDAKNGNDELIGNAGNDQLTGGGGSDLFIFETQRAFRRTDFGVDTITNFESDNIDLIALSRTTFGLSSSIGFGFSQASEFAIVANNTAAATSSAQIIYSLASGSVFYNPNGTADGFGDGGRFIVLANRPNINEFVFLIRS